MGHSLKANVFIGIAGGLIGTALMNAVMKAGKKMAAQPQGESNEEPATDQLASRVMKKAGNRYPSKRQREVGGQMVHWGYGATWGALAGVVRATGVPLAWGGGQALGTGLWAMGDLWLVYKMGLAKHPREYPKSVHMNALAAHLAYGFGVWTAFKAAERMMKRAPQHSYKVKRAA